MQGIKKKKNLVRIMEGGNIITRVRQGSMTSGDYGGVSKSDDRPGKEYGWWTNP